MTEEWRPIPITTTYPYEVSDQGRIRRGDVIINQCLSHCGYKRCTLNVDGKPKQFKVHRLVLLAFVGESDLYALHSDGNPLNNSLTNLRYGTPQENTIDRNSHGSWPLTEDQVRTIRSLKKEGWPVLYLMKLFHKSRRAIYDIVGFKSYQWVV